MKYLSSIRAAKPLLSALMITLPLLLATGCKPGIVESDSSSSSSSSSSSVDNDLIYRGPGFFSWQLNLEGDDSTFKLKRSATPGADADETIDGSYAEFSNGFLRLSPTASDANLISGNAITGIQFGDELTLLQPFRSDTDQLVILAHQSDCPSNSINSNWLLYRQAVTLSTDKHTSNHFGTYSYSTIDDGKTNLERQYGLSDPTPDDQDAGGIGLSTGICNEGLLTESNYQYYFSSGASIIAELANTEDDISTGETQNTQFLLSVEKRTISGSSSYSGSYIGLLYDSGLNTGFQNFPVKGTCDSGSCTLYQVTDTENGAQKDSAYTLDLRSTDDTELNRPADGFVVGTLTEPGSNSDSRTISCSINTDYEDSGEMTIACVGISPGSSNTDKLLNLFLVAKS